MSKWIAVFCVLTLAAAANAVTVEKPLADSALEMRAQAIFAELKCVVCEGQALSESDAPLAIDMRQTIRSKLREGESDASIYGYFTARYGEVILLKPPITQHTWALWAMPMVAFLIGSLFVARFFLRGRRA